MAESGLSIPLIDISGFTRGDEASRSAIVAAVGAAAEQYGFMRLTGHGIAPETIEAVFSNGRAFFAQPEAEKLKIRD
jgi:isopenicillin N synthase-like dioxygenase